MAFGGFDRCIEEWFAFLFALRDAGYEVVAFDRPSPGSALEDFQLPMAADGPHHQLDDQVKTLRNARSRTTEVLTRAASTPDHCHVGNLAQSLKVIVTWLDSISRKSGEAPASHA